MGESCSRPRHAPRPMTARIGNGIHARCHTAAADSQGCATATVSRPSKQIVYRSAGAVRSVSNTTRRRLSRSVWAMILMCSLSFLLGWAGSGCRTSHSRCRLRCKARPVLENRLQVPISEGGLARTSSRSLGRFARSGLSGCASFPAGSRRGAFRSCPVSGGRRRGSRRW